MTKLALVQGAYQARSPIANSQSCLNLIPENNPPDSPFPVTHYPAPGLAVLQDFSAVPGVVSGVDYVRGIYNASSGSVILVIGVVVLNWQPGQTPPWNVVGSLQTNTNQPVQMCDNGNTLVIVDGGSQGYQVPLTSLNVPNSLQLIVDEAFYGSNRVDFIDTFLIFNWPGTPTFYTTTSNVVTPFDPTYFASKEGWNDRLASLAALHDNIWLLGNTTTEIWFNAGGSAFPFARMPNSVLQQGCAAPYSVVVADNAVYWLSQDRWGRNMLMRGEGYAAKRVSTFAVEWEWSTYSYIADCIGMAYQIGGHEMVCFYFPNGNAWWTYDATTQLWHKRTYSDTTTAWLPYCIAGWGSVQYVGDPNAVLAGDRTAPRLLQISQNFYTDIGAPIIRQRSWMHVQNDGKRVAHTRFSASMVGAAMVPDEVNLDWSDDGGQTYGNPVPQTTNNTTNGQYQWRRLGYARDRVYRLQWGGVGECALNGAWIDMIPADT
jgi:hypothetical protein